MSIAQNPLTGQMRNSMANFNTFVHKGQNVVSSKPLSRKDANTVSQQLQRASFKLIADAFQALGGYGELGFPIRPITQSAYNVFMQLNLPNAIDSSGDVPVIDYNKLLMAKGGLAPVEVSSVSINATGISFSFFSNIDFPNASESDMLTVLVKKTNGAMKVARQVRGADESVTVLVAAPGVLKEEVEFVYVFVNTKDGKKVSNSKYVSLE